MRAILALIALASFSTSAAAQAAASSSCWIRGDASRLPNRASRLDSARVEVGGAPLTVCYSRPAARGRQVMGGLVPFGQPWRLGANEATAVHVPFAAEIAGVTVEPGVYSLYAIPGDTSWQVVVNRGVERWGIPINAELRAQDVGTGTVRVERLAEPVEELTLRFGPVAANATELIIEWERTRVRVPVRRVNR
jgi:hypothetical protein